MDDMYIGKCLKTFHRPGRAHNTQHVTQHTQQAAANRSELVEVHKQVRGPARTAPTDRQVAFEK
jgi:hypothetical protein